MTFSEKMKKLLEEQPKTTRKWTRMTKDKADSIISWLEFDLNLYGKAVDL